MKFKIIAIVLIVAMLGALLVACSKVNVQDLAAQKALDYLLDEINGPTATTVKLDTDSIKINSMEYVTFTFEDETAVDTEYPVYAYKISIDYTKADQGALSSTYYITVTYANEQLSAKATTEDNYENYSRRYKTKDGKIKAGDIKKMLPVSIEELQGTVAARKAAADAEEAALARAQAEQAAFEAGCAPVRAKLVDAYANGSITAETTTEQLVALLPAASDTLVYDTTTDVAIGEMTDLEEGKFYVRVDERPAAGYLQGTYSVFVYNTSLFIQYRVNNGTVGEGTIYSR